MTLKVKPESEAQFQAVIVDLARRLGWRVFHPWTSIHSAAGWPDLFLCRGSVAIAAELKTERGVVSTAQLEWLAALRSCGIQAYVWRPSQKQEIAHILSAAT